MKEDNKIIRTTTEQVRDYIYRGDSAGHSHHLHYLTKHTWETYKEKECYSYQVSNSISCMQVCVYVCVFAHKRHLLEKNGVH